MLKQLKPKVVIPPSPNSSAWMARAMEVQMQAAQGPRITARTPLPTAWAVVPPGIGTLNIISTKEKAAPITISGISLVLRAAFTLLTAVAQNGIMIAYPITQVTGLRYPSGICMNNHPFFSL